MKEPEGNMPHEKPDIYRYHDYRKFLKDHLEYLKTTQGFSVRRLAKDANIAVGYLPMVLSGARRMTIKTLFRIKKPLHLTNHEGEFLELLVRVADSDLQEARLLALKKIQRFREYRKLNPKEFEAYRYLTHWYYVAIREMVNLKGFQPDPLWLKDRLKGRVPLSEVTKALNFLKEHGFIEISPEGRTKLPQKNVECVGGVYQIALSQFHREMLRLASESLNETTYEERTVMGHTLSIPAQSYLKISKILEEALDRVADLEKTEEPKEMTYQVTVSAFPLSKEKEEA